MHDGCRKNKIIECVTAALPAKVLDDREGCVTG